VIENGICAFIIMYKCNMHIYISYSHILVLTIRSTSPCTRVSIVKSAFLKVNCSINSEYPGSLAFLTLVTVDNVILILENKGFFKGDLRSFCSCKNLPRLFQPFAKHLWSGEFNRKQERNRHCVTVCWWDRKQDIWNQLLPREQKTDPG
jgi:hypothetical protein